MSTIKLDFCALKRLFSGILACSFLLVFACTAAGADIIVDGVMENTEWGGFPQYTIVGNGDVSNCDVIYTALKRQISSEESAVYFAFGAVFNELSADNQLCGISLKIGDSAPIVATARNEIPDFDADLFSFDYRLEIGSANDFVCEMRIGLKYGIERSTPMEIRIIDGNGVPSNVYSYSLANEFITTAANTTKAPKTKTEEDTDNTKATVKKSTTKKLSTEVNSTTKKERYTRPERTVRATTATERITTSKVTKTTALQVDDMITANKSNSTATALQSESTCTVAQITTEPIPLEIMQDSSASKRKQIFLTAGCVTALAAITVWSILPKKNMKE